MIQTVTGSRHVFMFSKEVTSSFFTVMSLSKKLCLLITWYAKDKFNKLELISYAEVRVVSI